MAKANGKRTRPTASELKKLRQENERLQRDNSALTLTVGRKDNEIKDLHELVSGAEKELGSVKYRATIAERDADDARAETSEATLHLPTVTIHLRSGRERRPPRVGQPMTAMNEGASGEARQLRAG